MSTRSLVGANDVTRTVAAWVLERSARRNATRAVAVGAAHLRLQVVQDGGSVLLVQVAQGAPRPTGALLWLEDRGPFEVAAVLRRHDVGGDRFYMRLREQQPPRAA